MILRTLWRTRESLVSRALVRTPRSAWLIRIAVARFAASNGKRGSLLQPATAKVHKAKPTKPLHDPDILVMNVLSIGPPRLVRLTFRAHLRAALPAPSRRPSGAALGWAAPGGN